MFKECVLKRDQNQYSPVAYTREKTTRLLNQTQYKKNIIIMTNDGNSEEESPNFLRRRHMSQSSTPTSNIMQFNQQDSVLNQESEIIQETNHNAQNHLTASIEANPLSSVNLYSSNRNWWTIRIFKLFIYKFSHPIDKILSIPLINLLNQIQL